MKVSWCWTELISGCELLVDGHTIWVGWLGRQSSLWRNRCRHGQLLGGFPHGCAQRCDV